MEKEYMVMSKEFATILQDYLACLFIYALGGPDEQKKDLLLALSQEYAHQTFVDLTNDLSDITGKSWKIVD